MTSAVVHANGRDLGRIEEDGELQINPRRLGSGPVTLYATATLSGGSRSRVAAAPVQLTIEPNKPLAAIKDPPANLAPGMVLRLADGKIVPIQKTDDPAWLSTAGVGAQQPFVLQGYFDIAAEDVYQFQIWHYGELKLIVDGQTLFDGKEGDYTQKFMATALAAGKHRLTVNGRTASNLNLKILFGGPGAVSLNGATFRHARTTGAAPAKAAAK